MLDQIEPCSCWIESLRTLTLGVSVTHKHVLCDDVPYCVGISVSMWIFVNRDF